METQCPYVLDRAGQDVHAETRQLRAEQGPVARVELPDGVLAWSVTSYELVKQVLSDTRFQKDATRHWPAYINGEIPAEWQMINWVVMENMTTRDNEDHHRLRSPIAKAFTPRSVEAARPLIEKIANDLLDAMAAMPGDQAVDLKECYTFTLPAIVICELFGVPESDRAAALYGGQVNASTDITGEEAVASIAQYHSAFEKLVAEKQREPADDLTSALIAAQDVDGARLTAAEMVGSLHLLLGAGSETVMNVLSHAVINLLSNPWQLDMVLSGEVSWEAVVEETLRCECPVAMLPFRFAVEDVELGDVTIRKGEPVLVGFAGAGRDPAVHGETAAEFDITRANKTHLSFGHGRHFCLGAPLARLEMSIALPALFDRFPGIRLAIPRDELEPLGTFVMNGHRTVPVYLRAAD
jgi:2-hydroxy-5-methyl-1-naphthoate 7-hydroxylase